MSGHSCLYRRPSGIYAVRIVVPKRLRDLVGRGEIHTTTGLRDWNAAKLAALKIQLHWRGELMALDLEKLSAGSPLLLGEGLIPVDEAARAIGLTAGSLLGEMRNGRIPIFVQAQAWQGWQVPDLDAIERDYDGSGFVLNDVEAKGFSHSLSGTPHVYDCAATIAKLIKDGEASESTFRLSGDAGFFCADEQTIRSHDDRFDAMVNKLDLIGKDTSKMEVIAITDKIQKKQGKTKDAKNKDAGKGGFTIGESTKQLGKEAQHDLQFEIGEIERAIYAKLVQKVGNRHHWEDWANDIAKIARTHIDRITGILENEANTKEREAFKAFAHELRDDLNDSI